jgi:hypothetical protein
MAESLVPEPVITPLTTPLYLRRKSNMNLLSLPPCSILSALKQSIYNNQLLLDIGTPIEMLLPFSFQETFASNLVNSTIGFFGELDVGTSSKILEFCDPESLMNLAQTCKTLRKLVYSIPVWADFCINLFQFVPENPREYFIQSLRDCGESIRDIVPLEFEQQTLHCDEVLDDEFDIDSDISPVSSTPSSPSLPRKSLNTLKEVTKVENLQVEKPKLKTNKLKTKRQSDSEKHVNTRSSSKPRKNVRDLRPRKKQKYCSDSE